MKCSLCHKSAKLIETRYGFKWTCQDCDASVGCHKGTKTPLGTMATSQTRKARMRAHDAFDPIWKESPRRNGRKKAYFWLAKKLGIDFRDCHIGLFDEETCNRVVEICQEKLTRT